MAWDKCETCNKEFFRRSKETKCPECENLVKDSKMEGTPLERAESKAERGSRLAAKATQNANVLDRFGNVLQVMGYVFMTIFVCGAVVSLFASQWILFGVSLLFIPVAFVNFNVFGSVFRAIGSYIQYKLN